MERNLCDEFYSLSIHKNVIKAAQFSMQLLESRGRKVSARLVYGEDATEASQLSELGAYR